MCLGACVMLLLMLFTFIGFPILMGQWLATEPFLFVPGSGHLARFLL
jgi:hypothetical protein